MSVELKCLSGYLVDHKLSITAACGSLPYASIENLFHTREKYGQDKYFSEHLATCANGSFTKKKKHKRKLPPNFGEIAALKHHEKIRERILCGIEFLSKFEEWKKYFNLNLLEETDHSDVERSFLLASVQNSKFLEEVDGKVLNPHQPVLYLADDVSYVISDVVNRLVSNEKNDAMLMSVGDAKFILPSKSAFFLSDITHFCRYFIQNTKSRKYNMIVIDPPWENKSVKRGAKYSSLPLWDIKKLPIPDLACEQALVVVWVTNKQKYRRFIIEELFPSWSCDLLGEWHWIKMTQKGEMVFDLDSTHKKPYEPFVIGQFQKFESEHSNLGCSSQVETQDAMDLHSRTYKNNGDEIVSTKKMVPKNQLICSVPCSLHSRKPPLHDIFREYLPKDPSCIELFARNLLPNWTSWGNEVLKYQHLDYFQTEKR